MIAPADLEHCREAIRNGSRSFHAASLLMPRRVRDRALALYAFCRLADDAVDEQADKTGAVLRLRDRLDAVFAGRPADAPADRAFAGVVAETDMPRALPEALLEGFAWDADGRRYRTLSEVMAYAARVAAAVGAMMCVLMGVRDRHALARACDLGLAMQLTNIARDVGEDARAGRLYLPLDWFEEAGIGPDDFLGAPRAVPEVRRMTRRILARAADLYARSEAGIPRLPPSCRPAIFAARHCYGAIGGAVARNGFDSIGRRARTTGARKGALLALSFLRGAASPVLPLSATLYARPEPEVAFLVEAAACGAAKPAGRGEALLSLLADLEARDRERRRAAAQVRPGTA
ncbi:MAG: phytoene/squalene synthase family protein [Rhodobacteraceae bacterium]|nr:phytoene/squalene synthase family protein [Paracoccaceae bacterium]